MSENNHASKSSSKYDPPSSFLIEQEQEEVFSSEKAVMDFITLRGIQTRTGVDEKHLPLFVLKEMMDNALDHVERSHSQQPKVTVAITLEENSLLHIRISNSTTKDTAVFTESTVRKIFSYSGSMSSKRNQFKITRGALGDAFKELLSIPYALAIEGLGLDKWERNFTRDSVSGKKFSIKLNVDKANQNVEPIIEVDDNSYDDHDDDPSIEVELYLPFDSYNAAVVMIRKFKELLNQYLYNTHIIFNFRIDDPANERVWMDIETRQTQTEKVIPNTNEKNNTIKKQNNEELQQSQQLQQQHKQQQLTSIHYYTFTEFENLLYGLEDNNAYAYYKLYRVFRECTNLKKTDELKSLTVGELKNADKDTKLRLFRSLRSALPPKEKLDLPPGISTKSKDRRAAIKKRIEQMGYLVTKLNYKCKEEVAKYTPQSVNNNNNGSKEVPADEFFDNRVQFPFLFEVAIATVSDCTSFNRKVYQLINNSPRYNTSVFKVDYGENMFSWTTKQGSTQYGYSLENILDKYGYTGDYDPNKPRSKKPNSIIMVNLISPKLEYKDYGKTSINLEPFIEAIGETLYKTCSGGGGRSKDKPYLIDVLREIIWERKIDWYSWDAATRVRKWWTQSDVFYATRLRLIETYGYTDKEIDREYLTSLIKPVCEKELHVKREQIGIIAADRAQLYFKGKWMDVGLEEIRELSFYGVDLLIIEKEGIAQQLAPFADEKGIALLYTRGFLTDYAAVLSEKSEREGCNIAILTDLDDSGLAIARDAPDAYRIGIDFETLEDLKLDIEDVQESYKPGNHLKTLQVGGKHAGIYSDEMVDYVEEKRVEINSVVTALDDNGKFWEWILQKLRDQFDRRDYNRAVDIPEYVIPECLESLNDKVKQQGIAILKEPRKKLQERLYDIGPGFLFDRTDRVSLEDGAGIMTINKYEQTLTDHSRHIIESDKGIKPLLDKIEDLVEEVGDDDDNENKNNSGSGGDP